MGITNFSGPVQTQTQQTDGVNNSDAGLALMTQVETITQNGTNTVSATAYLPQNSQITGFNIDVLTAYDSATSATLTIGTAAAGTQYVGGVNAKTAGRAAITYTAAQLTAMQNIVANVAVVISIAVVGATTVGNVAITVFYIQNPS